MDQALRMFVQTLSQFSCGASLPLTAVALKRNTSTITQYLEQNIEFAVHGYTHIDHSQLEQDQLVAELQRAQKVFADVGITAVGFRPPYLRRGNCLYAAIEAAGFSYASTQPIMWSVLDDRDLNSPARDAYRRAFEFYDPWDANRYPSLPQLYNKIVEIPVSLPDDEILLDRLDGKAKGLIDRTWRRILSQTYCLGELFTIVLHPERIAWCVDGLSAVLTKARTLTPPVWLARMDEIAAWWRARAAASIEVERIGDGAWRLSVTGPQGTTFLVRGVETAETTQPWADGYRQAITTPRNRTQVLTCTVQNACRPFVGISPSCAPALIGFLHQQGYVCQVSKDNRLYSIYIDRPHFAPEDRRPLLAQIEKSAGPLVRLGRWPHGTHSALCITGDIDALTLWDYGLRLFGN